MNLNCKYCKVDIDTDIDELSIEGNQYNVVAVIKNGYINQNLSIYGIS